MKSTILLTIALFLASAPSPDSKAISEFSAGFLAHTADIGLTASEFVQKAYTDKSSSAQKALAFGQ